jgi:hypothetical protein
MIAFICLLRGAAPDLPAQIAAQAQPGDQVILVDDSGDDDALTRIRTLHWPQGVTLTPIVTGTAGPGDGGIATNLALDRVTTSHVLILEGAAQLTGRLPRTLNQTLLCGPSPVLSQMIFPATKLRRTEGTARSDIAFMWALQQAYPITQATKTWAQTTPNPGPSLLTAVAALLIDDPAATQWVKSSLPHWLSNPAPGARLILNASEIPLNQSLKNATPPQIGTAKLTIALRGHHANRTPLAYSHLAPLWADHLTLTDGTADLEVYGHPRDIITPRGNSVLLSEEPFWDSLLSPAPLADVITLPMGRVHQLNHHTSAIFAYDRIPYFVLTDPRYIRAYQGPFTRNAALSPADWQAQFAARQVDAFFMAEYRMTGVYDFAQREGDIIGLCSWRTRLALAAPGRVRQQGAGWPGSGTRFDLTDWHGDKLRQLDNHTRILSAMENTHQPAYLSEKFFDAFAVGARPLYYASPAHSVHTLGLPQGSWVNLHGLTSDQAANALPTSEDADFFAAYATAQAMLRDLFTEDTIAAERARLGRAVIADLQRLAESGPV